MKTLAISSIWLLDRKKTKSTVKMQINEEISQPTRKGKIFRSSVVRSPKPNAGINVSESYFSNVRPTIVMT